MAQKVKRGCRVVVPLGSKKQYTGIIDRIHHEAPVRYEVKYAFALLEEQPVVLPKQLQLWEWIADYYMCAEGDVYNAAVPAGLLLFLLSGLQVIDLLIYPALCHELLMCS